MSDVEFTDDDLKAFFEAQERQAETEREQAERASLQELARALAVYFEELLKAGFGPKQAFTLTRDYQNSYLIAGFEAYE